MIKARGACKQGAGQWSDERRLLIKPGSLSLSISLFLSLSAGRAKYGVEWYGKGGRQWEITLVHGIIVHAFRRVTARRHRWSRLRRNAQRRPLLPVAPALVVPPTLLVCSRIADHRRFFTNFVHAIQDKKKKKKLVYVQPCEFVPSHFVHHLRFQSDFRFVFPPILSSSFGIFLWNNSFVDIDLCF